MVKSYKFYVPEIMCSSCVATLESHLGTADFIKSCRVEQISKQLTILLEQEEQEEELRLKINKLLNEVGFSAEKSQEKEAEKKTSFINSHWFLGILGTTTGLALLITCLVLGSLPLMALIPIAIISTLLTVFLGARSYFSAAKKLFKKGSLTMDTLFTISTISALAVSIGSFFVPWLPMMFETGLLIFGFRHIGLAIEERIKEKIKTDCFLDRTPKKARRWISNEIQEADIKDIQIEDIIIIHPGELIPLDGICVEASSIYTTIISGATLPRYFRAEEPVLAGMRLAKEADPLKIKVLKQIDKSYLAMLDENIDQSIQNKAPLEIKSKKILAYFIPGIIALSLISGIVLSIFFPPAIALQCAFSILVSACPCTLGFINSYPFELGKLKAADKGALFKGSEALIKPEQIDTVVFDLNGTLTTGVPRVTNYHSLLPKKEFLSLCASLEKNSTHPVGKAIYHFANQDTPEILGGTIDKPHHAGITGTINDDEYAIGSLALMPEETQKIIESQGLEEQLELAAGDSVIYVARNKELIGYIIVTDPLRKDALHTIKTLREHYKKEIYICTGANEKTAQRYAEALGIPFDNIHADCVATTINSQDKSKPVFLHSLKEEGRKVAMIEDSSNGVHALAASDCGIVMVSQNSDDLTLQHASVIIQSESLLPILSTFSVSEQTVSNINQNLFISLAYNLSTVLVSAGLLLGLGLVLNPGVGVALMVLQACVVLLNVYRFKKQEIPHLEPEPSASQEKESLSSSYGRVLKPNLNLASTQTLESHGLEDESSKQQRTTRSLSFWKEAPAKENQDIGEQENQMVFN